MPYFKELKETTFFFKVFQKYYSLHEPTEENRDHWKEEGISRKPRIPNMVLAGFGCLLAVALVLTSWFIVPEGHIKIVKTMGEATSYQGPGFHFKIPIVQTTHEMEVRTRKYELAMSAATTGKTKEGNVELQMPSTVTIAANWNIPPDQSLEIYKKYGSLQAYEDRILDPRVQRVTKAIISQHTIEELMTQRAAVELLIQNKMVEALVGLNVVFSDVSLANIDWNPKIKGAVIAKQQSKLAFEKEQYELDKQNLEAQRGVNTANAQAEAIAKISIEKAKAIEREGKMLAKYPAYVELTKVQQWDGKLPHYLMAGSEGAGILHQLPLGGMSATKDNVN